MMKVCSCWSRLSHISECRTKGTKQPARYRHCRHLRGTRHLPASRRAHPAPRALAQSSQQGAVVWLLFLATPAGPSLLRFRESSSPSALRPLSRQLPHTPPCPPSSPCLDGGGGVRRVCRMLSVDAGSVSLVCTLEPPKGLRPGLHPEPGILCVCGGLPGGSGERPG